MQPIILPVPHLQQRNAGECLAACAFMALTFLNISIEYGQLLSLLRVRKSIGTPASNIHRLETLGVKIIYKQGTIPELHHHLIHGRPCITFVRTNELPYWDIDCDHAIVVVGLDDNYIYLNDPEFSQGMIQIPQGDFDLAWLEWDELYAAFI